MALCKEITKLGVQCKRNATYGDFCASHKKVELNEDVLLFKAFFEKDIRLMEELIRNGSNVNIYDPMSVSLLCYAVIHENEEIVKLLLENDAKVNYHDTSSDSILHYAARNKNTNIINILLNYGANVFDENENGETPLDYAKRYNLKDNIQLLEKKMNDIESEIAMEELEYEYGIPEEFLYD